MSIAGSHAFFAFPAAMFVCATLAAAAQLPAPDTLTLTGPGQQTTISLAALKAMPHETVTVTNGHTHQQETYAGVPLATLLVKVGAPEPGAIHGKVMSEYILASGSDNYHVVLSLGEIESAFHPGKVLVADMLNGKPLDTQQGPFKLVVEEDKMPARSVHNLVKLELKQAE
jgi:hypothetical protein